jgi:hypothetical protein
MVDTESLSVKKLDEFIVDAQQLNGPQRESTGSLPNCSHLNMINAIAIKHLRRIPRVGAPWERVG